MFFADTGAISAALVLMYRSTFRASASNATSLGLDENHPASRAVVWETGGRTKKTFSVATGSVGRLTALSTLSAHGEATEVEGAVSRARTTTIGSLAHTNADADV